ncbi:hypothetical protein RHMOL_Rhmol07G0060800 [Rhododendron molle]|uniref:Uncharacterized protein n=1 Tax=Rhododendron molle TaxID=49168 RepID=A0ACC0MZ03_RHOML|nr:hypothetical protein RHMOL_Rhmol07G0060800 [Rhododendron molle]
MRCPIRHRRRRYPPRQPHRSMKKRSPSSSTPSLQEPNSKKISLRPSSCYGLNTQCQCLTSCKTLDGFTKIPFPITSPFSWASPDSSQSAPTLRRCVSDPVSSPRINSKGGDTSGVLTNHPLSPEDAKIVAASASTLSPAKAGSSASVTLPVVSAILRRSFSDPSPKASRAAMTQPELKRMKRRDLQRMKRMKDGMREMRQWLDEVMREGEEEEVEEDGGSELLDDKNGAPKDQEPETESEEAVSVETSGKVLIIHIKCPCGKGFRILLYGNNCYYKLL